MNSLLITSSVINNEKLTHHSIVFVFHDVAVIHIRSLRIRIPFESHDDSNKISGRNENCILPSELCSSSSLTVAIQNLKLNQVDVEWMRLTATIGHFPDLNIPQLHYFINPIHIH